MPTGYTYPIEEHESYTFEQFVWSCARAFGALILMRDEPSGAPIPDEFQPSDTYAKWASEAKSEIVRLSALTPEQAETEAAEEYARELARSEAYNLKTTTNNARFLAMRSKVADWQPPTSEHEGLKRFMLEQLDLSVSDYVSPPPVKRGGPDWLRFKLTEAHNRAERSVTQNTEEIARTNGRNDWLKALRESVPYQEQPTKETR
jgi:hypothetical protein